MQYHAYTRPLHPTTELIIAEDNQAVIKIVSKMRSLALRHLPRTHRIDVNWLFEVCQHPEVRMVYCNTKQQVADLMTKAMTSPPLWSALVELAQIRSGSLPGDTKACPIVATAAMAGSAGHLQCSKCEIVVGDGACVFCV